ncbi:MAG: cobalt ECF transporter T component CbiQ [Nitrospira bacterium HGW-Nitrospira-1]|nr:MAG: cobalt ECF transporter T component CbiQ [Nitrospira bacterium HGW-Nitrospira-1]
MRFDNAYFNLGYLDTLSYRDTIIHRLDPRTKLMATLFFIVTVVSFPMYEVSGLLPFLLFPVLLFSLADIPVKFIMKKVLLVSTFAFFIGIFNPVFDRQAMYVFYGVTVSGGWVSFLSIMIKFFLTITSALLLIATTSFPGICRALQKFGIPDIFISQLLFLYRYIFVLAEEAMKVVRARDIRSFGKRGKEMTAFTGIVGTLFLRTVERAERIYQAMLSRGFSGALHTAKPYGFTGADAVFLTITVTVLYLLRVHDVVGAMGRLSISIF